MVTFLCCLYSVAHKICQLHIHVWITLCILVTACVADSFKRHSTLQSRLLPYQLYCTHDLSTCHCIASQTKKHFSLYIWLTINIRPNMVSIYLHSASSCVACETRPALLDHNLQLFCSHIQKPRSDRLQVELLQTAVMSQLPMHLIYWHLRARLMSVENLVQWWCQFE